jgi:Holliday junction resolvase RusA-like endonuclease
MTKKLKKRNKEEVTGTIYIKPLSVNKCWLGRRRKSADYRKYEQIVASCIEDKEPLWDRGRLTVSFTFGFSNNSADVDNPIKPLQDILQSVYKFNDKRIFRLIVDKVLVKKGTEFLSYSITPYKEDA